MWQLGKVLTWQITQSEGSTLFIRVNSHLLILFEKLKSVYVGEEESRVPEGIHWKLLSQSYPPTPVPVPQDTQTSDWQPSRELGRCEGMCLGYSLNTYVIQYDTGFTFLQILFWIPFCLAVWVMFYNPRWNFVLNALLLSHFSENICLIKPISRECCTVSTTIHVRWHTYAVTCLVEMCCVFLFFWD